MHLLAARDARFFKLCHPGEGLGSGSLISYSLFFIRVDYPSNDPLDVQRAMRLVQHAPE